MMRVGAIVATALALLAAIAWTGTSAAGEETIAPPEHRRPPDQTFLTYPEWFLVHSPAEYADYVRDHMPTRFPFQGHVAQFWQSYGAVYDRIRSEYPFNAGYHVMIMVIGISTTVEYEIRSGYETIIGRLSGLTAGGTLSEEDRYGAAVAQDYVDFIRVQPWYEYDFLGKLAGLWKQTALWGPAPVRKWERKYALTTEYAIKAVYGWLIKKGTKASYDAPLPVTAVLLTGDPGAMPAGLTQTTIVSTLPDGRVLVTVPRYDAFMRYADALARNGVEFVEIAGNRSAILVTLLAADDWVAPPQSKSLFTQPIITKPGQKRFALEVPVGRLGAFLNGVRGHGVVLEHVYDF